VFIGSKLLQDMYGMNVQDADILILIPEGITVVMSIPLGVWLEKSEAKLHHKLFYLANSCFALLLSYLSLTATTLVNKFLNLPIKLASSIHFYRNNTYTYQHDKKTNKQKRFQVQ
jgi:hypothetical protein